MGRECERLVFAVTKALFGSAGLLVGGAKGPGIQGLEWLRRVYCMVGLKTTKTIKKFFWGVLVKISDSFFISGTKDA